MSFPILFYVYMFDRIRYGNVKTKTILQNEIRVPSLFHICDGAWCGYGLSDLHFIHWIALNVYYFNEWSEESQYAMARKCTMRERCEKIVHTLEIISIEMQANMQAKCSIRQWKIKQNIWLINSINWMITIYFSCCMFHLAIIFNLNGTRAPPNFHYLS